VIHLKQGLLYLLCYLIGGATVLVGNALQGGDKNLLSSVANDRREWEVAVAYLDAEALSNPDQAKRDEAYMMVKLARMGKTIGFADGQRLCP
jgi:hypothetical protein